MVTLKLLIPASALLLLMACGKELRVNAQNNKDAVKQPAAPQAVAGGSGSVFKDCPDCPEMIVIPAGSFQMGGTTDSGELPVHRVTLRSFLLGKTEVARGQWRAVMGSNPSFGNCDDNCPVDGVNWEDAKQFVSRLSAKTRKTYRLPSEAEWEYACRAGARQEYCGSDSAGDVAWHGGKSPSPVAGKRANAWGLYDMSGNAMVSCLKKAPAGCMSSNKFSGVTFSPGSSASSVAVFTASPSSATLALFRPCCLIKFKFT